jgi:hypothetical protein
MNLQYLREQLPVRRGWSLHGCALSSARLSEEVLLGCVSSRACPDPPGKAKQGCQVESPLTQQIIFGSISLVLSRSPALGRGGVGLLGLMRRRAAWFGC